MYVSTKPFIEWLMAQPVGTYYDYFDNNACLIARYLADHGIMANVGVGDYTDLKTHATYMIDPGVMRIVDREQFQYSAVLIADVQEYVRINRLNEEEVE